jgi:hypothetical protein
LMSLVKSPILMLLGQIAARHKLAQMRSAELRAKSV